MVNKFIKVQTISLGLLSFQFMPTSADAMHVINNPTCHHGLNTTMRAQGIRHYSIGQRDERPFKIEVDEVWQHDVKPEKGPDSPWKDSLSLAKSYAEYLKVLGEERARRIADVVSQYNVSKDVHRITVKQEFASEFYPVENFLNKRRAFNWLTIQNLSSVSIEFHFKRSISYNFIHGNEATAGGIKIAERFITPIYFTNNPERGLFHVLIDGNNAVYDLPDQANLGLHFLIPYYNPMIIEIKNCRGRWNVQGDHRQTKVIIEKFRLDDQATWILKGEDCYSLLSDLSLKEYDRKKLKLYYSE